jgi:hypothetical protein
MRVLVANDVEYNELDGYRNGNHVLKFIKDNNNNWVVPLEVLEYPAFSNLKSKLVNLEEIEYKPLETDNE